jgi:hypothetical protein
MVALVAWPWGVSLSALESSAEVMPIAQRPSLRERGHEIVRACDRDQWRRADVPVVSQMSLEEEEDEDAGLLSPTLHVAIACQEATTAAAVHDLSAFLGRSLPMACLCCMRC